MSIEAHAVSWVAGRRPVLDGVSLHVQPGEVLGLLGPNGSGKSTLLRLLAGVTRPTAGHVSLEGRDLRAWRRRDVARRLAVVAQHSTTEVDLTVGDVIGLGRIPHRSLAGTGGDSAADRAAVGRAVERTELDGWLDRSWHTLSGGERQRVQIARALAQEPSELLLDEPTNHLDIHHQLELLGLVRTLGVTSVVALHDLNLAAIYCDRLAVLEGGRLVACGPPAEVLTPALIGDVYRVRAVVTADGPGGVPAVRFDPGTMRCVGRASRPDDERG